VRIGAHVRTPGGILSVVASAHAIGAEAVQLFASNPRAWAPPRLAPETVEGFRAAIGEAGIGPVYLHAPYLVNIASPNAEFHRKSVDLARASMQAAAQLGAAGLVVHAGSGGPGGPGEPERGLERAARALGEIVREADGSSPIVELMAGGRGAVASTFAEAAALFRAVEGGERLLLCADTCHLFVAGYELDHADGVAACFAELRTNGLDSRLVLVHANDAAFPHGSRRDRHANIGTGFIGRRGFAAILADPSVRGCAVLCETPGDPEVRRHDLDTLKSLAKRAS
jgi:deoxyribonuclease IV